MLDLTQNEKSSDQEQIIEEIKYLFDTFYI